MADADYDPVNMGRYRNCDARAIPAYCERRNVDSSCPICVKALSKAASVGLRK